jgi:hypothetical protein
MLPPPPPPSKKPSAAPTAIVIPPPPPKPYHFPQPARPGPAAIIGYKEDLIAAFDAWVDKVQAEPMLEEKAFQSDGKVIKTTVKKMRALTIQGFCGFLGIHTNTYYDWRRNRADLRDTILQIDDAIKDQKFTGAAAGLLNASIIQRDLGLADNIRNQHEVIEPAQKVSPEHIADIIHPDMSLDQEMALRDAGQPIPLYTELLLRIGTPFIMPEVPSDA